MKRKGGGFTLVEIMMALTVFFILAGIVFNFFVGGSKYASKGAWRVHAVASMRNGLRVVKSNMEASSYPTVVRLDNFNEAEEEAYMVRLAGAHASSLTSDHTVYTYNKPVADFMVFTCCNTLDETTPGTPKGGDARQFRFQLENSAHRNLASGAPNSHLMDLLMVQHDDTVASEDDGSIIAPTAFVEGESKRLCFDVESVDILVPTSAGAFLDENSIVLMRIHCRDPLNGRMLLAEEAKAQVNVQIMKPVAP